MHSLRDTLPKVRGYATAVWLMNTLFLRCYFDALTVKPCLLLLLLVRSLGVTACLIVLPLLLCTTHAYAIRRHDYTA
jgi:ABC-type glycerol-3-phosphate transport system permease component